MFGYGSLIWRPDFPYIERRIATVSGFTRRFWQGSHDHRGTPEDPGRVVTLIGDPGLECAGMAYKLKADVVAATFEQLDYREKNGYERHPVQLNFDDGSTTQGLVYIADAGNFAYSGEAPLAELAKIIARSIGPSGNNWDYLYELAAALRELNINDPHVFELETVVRKLRADY